MPLQINELTTAAGQAPPAWFLPAAAQIAQIAAEMAAQTKAMAQLQRQLDDLSELVRQRLNP